MLESIIQSQALYSTVMFIIVLSILVFVHELGHYLAAKSVGAKVKTFSIGFGKELFGFTTSSGERWKISLIPLGGYVDIFGMDKGAPDVQDLTDEKDLEGALYKKNVFAKMWVVAAGPLANFLFAIIALFGLYTTVGQRELSTKIGFVMENMPAAHVGIQEGDRILSINGTQVKTWPNMLEKLKTLGDDQTVNLVVDRDGKTLDFAIVRQSKEVKNILEEKVNKRLIGISPSEDYTPGKTLGVVEALETSVQTTYNMTTFILKAVKRMVTGQMEANVGGPITIAEQSGHAAQGGLYVLIMFMVMISINLGILNLLPIPMLDGGHLVYYTIELLTFGKGLHENIKFAANMIGGVLLLSLMIFAFYSDISRIFFQ